MAPRALGLVHMDAYGWKTAESEFQTAVRLRTASDVEPLVQYGRYPTFRGRNAEALQEFLLARNTEPALAVVSSWVMYAYYLRGQIDSALVERNRAYQNDSTNATTLGHGSLVLLKAGQTAALRALLGRIPPASPIVFYLRAALGDTAEAMSRARSPEVAKRWPGLKETIMAYAMLGKGDTTAAMDALERGGDVVLAGVHHRPDFRPAPRKRALPRHRASRRVGDALPPPASAPAKR